MLLVGKYHGNSSEGKPAHLLVRLRPAEPCSVTWHQPKEEVRCNNSSHLTNTNKLSQCYNIGAWQLS